MKLSKTQQKLLDRARSNGGFVSAESGAGRGGKGGRISYGSREKAAALGLVKLGLAREVKRSSGSLWTGDGHSVYYSVLVIELVRDL